MWSLRQLISFPVKEDVQIIPSQSAETIKPNADDAIKDVIWL